MLDSKRNHIGVRGHVLQFILVLGAVCGSASSIIAGSASAPLSIAVTVISTCRFSASALASGDYNPLINSNADLTSGVNMTLACTRGSNPSIAIGTGNYAGQTVTLQAMPRGGLSVPDPARISGQQNVPAGSNNDTLVVTVNF
jgi:spore coat protein U-like protein